MQEGVLAITHQHCKKIMAVEHQVKWQQYTVILITALNGIMLWVAYNVFAQVKDNTMSIVEMRARSNTYVTSLDVERIKDSVESQVRAVAAKMDVFMAASREQQIRFDIEQRSMSGQLTKLENTISRAVLVQPRNQDGRFTEPPIIPPKP